MQPKLLMSSSADSTLNIYSFSMQYSVAEDQMYILSNCNIHCSTCKITARAHLQLSYNGYTIAYIAASFGVLLKKTLQDTNRYFNNYILYYIFFHYWKNSPQTKTKKIFKSAAWSIKREKCSTVKFRSDKLNYKNVQNIFIKFTKNIYLQT